MIIEVTKSELAKQHKMSSSYLAHLLNVVYYDELVAVGYTNKFCKRLKPNVVRKFIELEGKAIRNEEL